MGNKELWFFLFFVGTLLFNWPFLDIFNLSLPLYLFGLWGLLIILVGFFIHKMNKQSNKGV